MSEDINICEVKDSDYLTSGGSQLLDKNNIDIDYYVVDKESTDNNSMAENLVNIDSTDNDNMRILNKRYYNYFMSETSSFIYRLLHENFDDGMTNEAIEQVKKFFKLNDFVTCAWLSYVYSKNLDNYRIISALLRVISNLDATQYSFFLLPIVKAGLSDKNVITQESAIMVTEEWRTKECLSALINTSYASTWIQEYADIIITELKEELD